MLPPITPFEPILEQFLMERYWATPWRRQEPLPAHVWKSLSTHVQYLSDAFTSSRDRLAPDYFQRKEARSAYLLYFHLANVTRNQAVLSQVLRAGVLPSRPLRVMDIGCGLGAASWALMSAHSVGELRLRDLILVDQDRKILEDAQKLIHKCVGDHLLPQIPLKPLAYDLYQPHAVAKLIHQGECDLMIASNLLNEMADVSVPELAELLKARIRLQLADDGVMILIEPAMNQTSRALTALRDVLLQEGTLETPLPCLHSGPCPLNREPRDWCHFECNWDVPPSRARLEKALGHNSGILKYSYVVFKKSSGKQGVTREKRKTYRVISDVLESREGFAVLLCDEEKKIAVHLGKKRLDVPVEFRKLRRGDTFSHPIELASQKGHPYALSARLKKGAV